MIESSGKGLITGDMINTRCKFHNHCVDHSLSLHFSTVGTFNNLYTPVLLSGDVCYREIRHR